MCGRFVLTTPDQGLAVQFNLPEVPDLKPRFNIAPTQPVAAVRAMRDGGDRELVMLHWGLVPFWAKDPAIGSRLINARSETASQKPSFRAAFRKRRCLVVADGFYEWQKVNGGKQPYLIRLRDAGAFGFAGLWEFWKGADDEVVESCTILTTSPNDLVRDIHTRMPVIVQPGDYELWLDLGVERAEMLNRVLRPYPSDLMVAYPVSRRVNSPKNDDPACIEPLAQGESLKLPGL